MKLHLLALVLFLAFSSTSATGQDTKPAPTPLSITVSDVWLDGFPYPAPSPQPAGAGSPQATATSPAQAATSATPTPVKRIDAGLRHRIWVALENLSDVVARDKINSRDLVLYLNGQEVKNTNPVAIKGPKENWLAFDLVRNDQSDLVWRSLLGSPTEQYRAVEVSVGFAGKNPFPPTPGVTKQPYILLHVVHLRWVIICFAILILLVFLFIRRAKKGGFIHDADPPSPPAGKLKPYSLALTQAAWWFFLVIASFVFIYMITGDYNTMTDQALILMGIGTGTALGAFMVNATKRDTSDTQLSTLRPQAAQLDADVKQLKAKDTELKQKIASGAATADDQSALRDNAVVLAEKEARLAEINKQIENAAAGLSKPVSEGFFNDVLTDVNGVALHRFQMAVWTFVLGMIFLVGVYRNLAMPQFSVTLLALLGISAGTYLGFKIPERQVDAKDKQKP